MASCASAHPAPAGGGGRAGRGHRLPARSLPGRRVLAPPAPLRRRARVAGGHPGAGRDDGTRLHGGPSISLRTAVDIMINKRIGCLPVVEDRKLVGLLSESDCLRHLAHLLEVAETKDGLPELAPAS